MHYRITAAQRTIAAGGTLRTVLSTLTASLPVLDPSQFGMADYDLYGGVVNFATAKANGIKRAIIRVGEGYFGIDPQFKASHVNARLAGLPRDFYWFLDIRQSANGQARDCVNAIGDDYDEDSILFADFESTYSTGSGKTYQHLDASFLWGFLSTVHTLNPKIKLGIYTGYDFWKVNGSIDPKYGFDKYPLWISWPVSPYRAPLPLAPWGNNWLYHQWTFNGDGKRYGLAQGGLDLDYKNPIYVTSPVPPVPVPVPVPTPTPTPTPTPSNSIYDVIGNPGDRIRSDPSFPADNSNVVGIALLGSKVYGLPTADGQFVHLNGYVAMSVLTPDVPAPDPIPTPIPSPSGTFYRVLHDQEFPPHFLPRMLYDGGNPNVGIPETVNLDNSLKVEIDKSLQEFIFALMQKYAPSSMSKELLVAKYKNLLGNKEAFTNGTGYPQAKKDGTMDGSPKANYITGEDLDQPNPAFDRPRLTGGAVVKVVDETPVMIAGVPHLTVSTLKVGDALDITKINPTLTPWFVFFCTTTTPFKLASGRYRVNRFPQLQDNDVPMILITRDGVGYIRADRLQKITNPFGVNPYVFS